MKKKLSIITLFIVSLVSNAQTGFQKYYFNSVTDRNANISILSDSSVLISRQTISGLKKYFELIKADRNGDTLWTRSSYDSYISKYYCVRKISNDYFYFGGYKQDSLNVVRNGALLYTDSLGTIIWTKSYPDTVIQVIRSILRFSDGNLLLAGSNKNQLTPFVPYEVIIKTDSVGNVIWVKYDALYGKTYFNAIEIADLGFIAENEYAVFRFDSAGNQVWRVSSIGSTIALHPTPLNDTEIVCIGFNASLPGIQAKKYDMTGTLLSANSCVLSNATEVNQIIPTDDYGFLVCGVSYNQFYQSDASFYKIDSAYNLQWQKDIVNYSLENATTAANNGDNYLLMANVNSFKSDTNGFSLTSVDSSGAIITGLLSIGPERQSCQIIPNPFVTTATIYFSNPEQKKLFLNIYDVLGNLVYKTEFSSSSSTIPRRNLLPGVYFYQLRDKQNQLAGGRIMIE